MNGQESLWAWLGVAVLAEIAGFALVLISDSEAWMLAGYGVVSIGAVGAFICAVGLGVTAGMLRYDHLRARRR